MNEGSGLSGRSIDRGTAAKAGLAVGVLVMVAAILGPATLTNHPPTSAATNHPGSTQRPGATARPSTAPLASAEPWADLVVPIFEPAAELTPTDLDRIGAAPDTSFTLRSLTSTPAVELAAGIRTDPPIKLKVKPGATSDLAVIRPAAPLIAGRRYRFQLTSPDGALAGSWAFVARAPLHVTATIPGDHAVEVPANTGIELTFDQDGTTGVPDRFSIKPAVAGRFEQHDRVWAFVPDKPLAPATIYTVEVRKGVEINGSTEVLETDVTFRFETAVATAAHTVVAFGRSILEVRPNAQPVVTVDFSVNEEEDQQPPTSIKVTVHRLPNFGALVAAARILTGPDQWAIAAPSAIVPTADLTKVAEVDGAILPSNFDMVLRIPVKLSQGFYVVTLVQPGAPAQLLLQVTDLSAYAQVATGATVVWVNDLVADTAITGATVALADGQPLGTTDEQGTARFTAPSESGAHMLVVSAPDGQIGRAHV